MCQIENFPLQEGNSWNCNLPADGYLENIGLFWKVLTPSIYLETTYKKFRELNRDKNRTQDIYRTLHLAGMYVAVHINYLHPYFYK